MEIEIEVYETRKGKQPFDDWFDAIRETQTQAKIVSRLDRLKLGNFGDCKSIKDNVCELRIHCGPGIRIYYSQIGKKIILLLFGGTKGSQGQDIKKAKEYLRDYQSRRS